MTDLLDYRGRIIRFVLASLLCAPVSVFAVFGFAEIVPIHGTSAAGGWFVIFAVPFVFILSMFGVMNLLARVWFREARAPLPRARLVRR